MPQLITYIKQLSHCGIVLISSLGLILFALPAQASLTCTISEGAPNISFGSDIDVWGAYPITQQSMTLTCTRGGIELGRKTRVCMYIGDGTAGNFIGSGAYYSPRVLSTGNTPIDNVAGFQIFKDAGRSVRWGTFAPNGTHADLGLDDWGTPSFDPFTKSTVMYLGMQAFTAAIKNGTTTLSTVPPGTYKTAFTGGNTLLKAARVISTESIDSDCNRSGGAIEYGSLNQQFPFSVEAVIKPRCEFLGTIADIDFGTQSGTATNLQGSTAFNMRCTRTTPYLIGLKPGNNNTSGAGVMVQGSDQVPYQLRKATGMGAAAWGNTGTQPSSPGNGVTSSGTGFSQNHIIYATVPSANAAVGSYSDIVTITVNY